MFRAALQNTGKISVMMPVMSVVHYVPGWGAECSRANAELLEIIDNYVADALSLGLTTGEISDDIVEQYPNVFASAYLSLKRIRRGIVAEINLVPAQS